MDLIAWPQSLGEMRQNAEKIRKMFKAGGGDVERGP
jgi:hypothetical protein